MTTVSVCSLTDRKLFQVCQLPYLFGDDGKLIVIWIDRTWKRIDMSIDDELRRTVNNDGYYCFAMYSLNWRFCKLVSWPMIVGIEVNWLSSAKWHVSIRWHPYENENRFHTHSKQIKQQAILYDTYIDEDFADLPTAQSLLEFWSMHSHLIQFIQRKILRWRIKWEKLKAFVSKKNGLHIVRSAYTDPRFVG